MHIFTMNQTRINDETSIDECRETILLLLRHECTSSDNDDRLLFSLSSMDPNSHPNINMVKSRMEIEGLISVAFKGTHINQKVILESILCNKLHKFTDETADYSVSDWAMHCISSAPNTRYGLADNTLKVHQLKLIYSICACWRDRFDFVCFSWFSLIDSDKYEYDPNKTPYGSYNLTIPFVTLLKRELIQDALYNDDENVIILKGTITSDYYILKQEPHKMASFWTCNPISRERYEKLAADSTDRIFNYEIVRMFCF